MRVPRRISWGALLLVVGFGAALEAQNMMQHGPVLGGVELGLAAFLLLIASAQLLVGQKIEH